MKCRVLLFISLVMLLTYIVPGWASLNNTAPMPNEQDMANLMAMLEKMTKEEGKPEQSLAGLIGEVNTSLALPKHDQVIRKQEKPAYEQQLSSQLEEITNDSTQGSLERLGEEGEQKIETLKEPFINLLKSSALTNLTDVIARQETAQTAFSSFIEYILQRNSGQQPSIQSAPMPAPQKAPFKNSDIPMTPFDTPITPSNVPVTPFDAQPSTLGIEAPAQYEQEQSAAPTGPVGMPLELAKIETPVLQSSAPELTPQLPEAMPLSTLPNLTAPATSTPPLPTPTLPEITPSTPMMPTPEVPMPTPTLPTPVPPTPALPEPMLPSPAPQDEQAPVMPLVSDMPSIEIPSDEIMVQPEEPAPAADQQAPLNESQEPSQAPQEETQQPYDQEPSTPPMPFQEAQMPSFQPEQQEQPQPEQPAFEPQRPIGEQPHPEAPEVQQAPAPHNVAPEPEAPQPLEAEQQPQDFPEITG